MSVDQFSLAPFVRPTSQDVEQALKVVGKVLSLLDAEESRRIWSGWLQDDDALRLLLRIMDAFPQRIQASCNIKGAEKDRLLESLAQLITREAWSKASHSSPARSHLLASLLSRLPLTQGAKAKGAKGEGFQRAWIMLYALLLRTLTRLLQLVLPELGAAFEGVGEVGALSETGAGEVGTEGAKWLQGADEGLNVKAAGRRLNVLLRCLREMVRFGALNDGLSVFSLTFPVRETVLVLFPVLELSEVKDNVLGLSWLGLKADALEFLALLCTLLGPAPALYACAEDLSRALCLAASALTPLLCREGSLSVVRQLVSVLRVPSVVQCLPGVHLGPLCSELLAWLSSSVGESWDDSLLVELLRVLQSLTPSVASCSGVPVDLKQRWILACFHLLDAASPHIPAPVAPLRSQEVRSEVFEWLLRLIVSAAAFPAFPVPLAPSIRCLQQGLSEEGAPEVVKVCREGFLRLDLLLHPVAPPLEFPRSREVVVAGPSAVPVEADSAKPVEADSAKPVEADSAEPVEADSAEPMEVEESARSEAADSTCQVVDLAKETVDIILLDDDSSSPPSEEGDRELMAKDGVSQQLWRNKKEDGVSQEELRRKKKEEDLEEPIPKRFKNEAGMLMNIQDEPAETVVVLDDDEEEEAKENDEGGKKKDGRDAERDRGRKSAEKERDSKRSEDRERRSKEKDRGSRKDAERNRGSKEKDEGDRERPSLEEMLASFVPGDPRRRSRGDSPRRRSPGDFPRRRSPGDFPRRRSPGDSPRRRRQRLLYE